MEGATKVPELSRNDSTIINYLIIDNITKSVKLDVLKLKNVTEIREQIQLINEFYNKNMTEEDIPFDDDKTWDLINRGDTLGIFQMASNVAIPVLKKIKPRNIEELSAVNAFIRPGSSGLEEYLIGKKDESKIRKLDPRIDRHLKSTYSAIVYQEQIMFLISELMGISFGKADLYRRALEKPDRGKNVQIVKDFNDNVVKIATERGFDPKVADLVRKLIIDNSGYGFNKCLSGREKIFNNNFTIEEMYKIKKDKEFAKEIGYHYLHEEYNKSYGNALSMDSNGKLIENKIIDITYSGEKEVYLVETENNKKVMCTMNHKFPTPNGKKQLSELSIGDKLYVVNSNNDIILSKITKIEFIIKENTYNVEMKAPYHNLLMNDGIIVSNSHSIAYSFISYWTAWIKANYPLVFYTTMLNGNLDQLSEFMAEAIKNGITIKPPHACYSKFESFIEDYDNKVIRIGLNAVKGIGPAAVESIVSTQPYSNINDFFERNNLRTVNKRVVEALISVDGLSGLGLSIEHTDIPDDIKEKLDIRVKDGKYELFMTRSQMKFWYDHYNELKAVKSIPNYEIPITMIKGIYMDIYELAVESNNTIIIPENKLLDFELKLEDVKSLRTRKRPKGFLKLTNNEVKIDPFRRPIFSFNKELSEIKEDYLETYLNESENLGFSFVPHPLEKHMDKIMIYNDHEDGDIIVIAGIIKELIKRKTKNNKNFYWLIVKTPREEVRVTLWDNQFKKYRDLIKLNNLVLVKGVKGYGGISCDTFKQINIK